MRWRKATAEVASSGERRTGASRRQDAASDVGPPSPLEGLRAQYFKRAQGLGAHTPLPHAAHSLSLECPSQRNRHLSPRLAAERAREAQKSVVCFRRAGVDHKRKGRPRFQARPRPQRSAREALKSVVCFRRAGVPKGRGEPASKSAQGLSAHTPLLHAAHSLNLECHSQRNRHLSRRLAAERAREKLGSRWCAFGAPALITRGRGELASSAPKASALTRRYPLRPTASASSAPAKETAI